MFNFTRKSGQDSLPNFKSDVNLGRFPWKLTKSDKAQYYLQRSGKSSLLYFSFKIQRVLSYIAIFFLTILLQFLLVSTIIPIYNTYFIEYFFLLFVLYKTKLFFFYFQTCQPTAITKSTRLLLLNKPIRYQKKHRSFL